ncbi:hypothetical protein ACWGLG_31900 [Streptomyces antimycoticus]
MAGGDQGAPAFSDGVCVVKPLDGASGGLGEVAHGGGDVDVVGEVAVRGCLAQAVEGGGEVVWCVAYGVVEGEGGFQEWGEPGEAGDGDLGTQDGGAVGDLVIGPGVAYEGGDVGVEGGGALVELGEVLVGEGEFVVGAEWAGEGGDQGEEGLGDSPLARGVVLFGFGPCGFEGGGGAVDVAVGPPDVGQDAVVAAFPAQGGDGGEGGGEVAPDTGEVGQAAVGAWGEPAVGVGDLAYAVRGGVGAAEVFVGLGPAVQGEFACARACAWPATTT